MGDSRTWSDLMATVQPQRQESIGHHACGEAWGWCGEHMAFVATYTCSSCGHRFTLEQCAAWPITRMDCERCFQQLNCKLDQRRAGCVLR